MSQKDPCMRAKLAEKLVEDLRLQMSDPCQDKSYKDIDNIIKILCLPQLS